MAKKKQVEAYVDELMATYWDDFLSGGDFMPTLSMDEDFKNVMHEYLEAFLRVLMYAKIKPLSQINAKDIQLAIGMIEQTLPKDEMFEDLWTNYMAVSRIFLGWLIKEKILGLTDDQVDDAYDEALDDPSIPGTDGDIEAINRKLYHYDKPDLPAYQKGESIRIRSKTVDVAEAFIKTDALKTIYGLITPDIENNVISDIADFATHMYGEYRLSPSKWSAEATQNILKGYFVKDALLKPEEFHNLGPTLKLFMDYAMTVDFIPETVGHSVKRAVDEVAPTLTRLGTNEANFSPEKRKILSLMKATEEIPIDEAKDYMQAELENVEEKGDVMSVEEWHKKRKKRKNKKKKK